MFKKKSSVYLLKSYTPFLLLKNLRKESTMFRYLLENCISEYFFLIYVYKTIISVPNCLTQFNSSYTNILVGIHIKWFINLSVKLKKGTFNWNCSRKMYVGGELLDTNSFKDTIVRKAIYLVLLEIYENKLNYFSKHSHGLRPGKNRHSALHEIKTSWQYIN